MSDRRDLRASRPETTTAPYPGAGVATRYATVVGNDWTGLHVPDHSQPTELPISVIIPTRDEPRLRWCIAALVEQHHPSDLLEIIIVDDGSVAPVSRADLPVFTGTLRIVRLEPSEGFGAGRARAAGADAATGDCLIFLDGDTVPGPAFLACHARWHAACDHAVVLGQVRMVEDDGPPGLFVDGTTRWQAVAWVGRTLDQTAGLRHDGEPVGRVVAGANLSIRAAFYRHVGGFRSLGLRGIEDTEFGYRTYTCGAVHIPDPDAFCWHPDERHFDDAARGQEAKERRSQLLDDHVVRRKRTRRRIASVPTATIDLVIEAHDTHDTVVQAIDDWLEETNGDAVIRLHGLEHLPERARAIVHEGVEHDPRIVDDPTAEVGGRFSRITVRTSPAYGEEARERYGRVQELTSPGVMVTVDPHAHLVAVAASTRALNRARYVLRSAEQPRFEAVASDEEIDLAGRLFPSHWVATERSEGEKLGRAPDAEPRQAAVTLDEDQRRATPQSRQRAAHGSTRASAPHRLRAASWPRPAPKLA